jgi:two-component system nitrate/nitrite response regulator NarL
VTSPRATEVVLADASLLHAEALALALSGRGYRVLAAADSREGLVRAVSQRPPDVCLVDSGLLGDGSRDLVGLLRALGPRTRVIVLSRGLDREAAEAAVGAGAAGYLRKDLGFDALDRALRSAASGEPAVAPAAALEAVRRGRGPREADGTDPRHRLTQREREVLRRLSQGDDTVALARALGMTVNTARTHVQNVLDKLGVHSRLEAVALANSLGGAGEAAADQDAPPPG